MSKIAPTLQHFVSARTCHQGECGGDAECEKVEKELRALLAVARAAKGLTGYLGSDSPGVNRWELSRPEASIVLALARLEKVSR
jgi:hypothetical protein